MHISVRWYHHVPRYLRPDAEGDHRARSVIDEGQDHRPTGTEILRLDRRIHLGFPLDLPADVDLEAGVRRERSFHRPPQMLLRYDLTIFAGTCFGSPPQRLIVVPVRGSAHTIALERVCQRTKRLNGKASCIYFETRPGLGMQYNERVGWL